MNKLGLKFGDKTTFIDLNEIFLCEVKQEKVFIEATGQLDITFYVEGTIKGIGTKIVLYIDNKSKNKQMCENWIIDNWLKK